jgi:hypothetical protein
MREAWLLFSEHPETRSRYARSLANSITPLTEQRIGPTVHGVDRLALHSFVADLRLLLDQMLLRGEELVEYEALDDLRAAWVFIEDEGAFDDSLRAILDPRSEEGLAAVGLVGAPREMKVNGFQRSLQRLREMLGRWTWKDIKPVLRWANVILGSLAKAIVRADAIKEFKESWEAAAEEAYE